MAAHALAIVVPTLNEEGNVERLVERLERTLDGVAWEIVFVDDDSRDRTLPLLRRLAVERDNVRVIHRIGRRGLSSACIEGILSTTAPLVAVMDADLQHDETLLPVMLDKLRRENLDIVVASRFAEGGGVAGGLSSARQRLSRIGNRLCHMVMKAEPTDPLSGFFLLRRELFDAVAHRLSGQGFKILLDIFASAPGPVAWGETPMTFRRRHAGESKLDTLVVLEFGLLLADKSLGRFIPLRFLMFVLVGLSGALVHLALLGLLFVMAGWPFLAAQATASVAAMTSNFLLNNEFTHRDRRLSGWRLLTGLLTFYAACSVGALANFQVAEFLFGLGAPWALAGLLGAGVGSVWNYAISSVFTWRRSARAARERAVPWPRPAPPDSAPDPAAGPAAGAAEREKESTLAAG